MHRTLFKIIRNFFFIIAAMLVLQGCIVSYSFTGAGPTVTPFGVVDLSPPIKTGPFLNADANGFASIDVFLPASLSGKTIYTQAVDINAGKLTNSLAEVIL